MPGTSFSPKYSRLASSRFSCHCSCQRIATRMNSSLTILAWSTSFGECWRIASRIFSAAPLRMIDCDCVATSSG